MFARLNYVGLRTDRMPELEKFWGDAVRPYDGLVRGYLLLDEAGTGRSLSVVLFRTERQMVENHGTLKDVARRAAEFRTSEPEVHYTRVVGEVAGNPGPVGAARVVAVTLKPDRRDEMVAGWPGHVASYRADPAFRGAYLCAPQDGRPLASITFWTDRAAIARNESSGAFKAAVDPYAEMRAAPPAPSYWTVPVVVGPG